MTEVMREEIRKHVQVFMGRLTMQNIIDGADTDCPEDWEALYKEYCEFMKQDGSFTHHKTRTDFCLTNIGYSINGQWLAEYSK